MKAVLLALVCFLALANAQVAVTYYYSAAGCAQGTAYRANATSTSSCTPGACTPVTGAYPTGATVYSALSCATSVADVVNSFPASKNVLTITFYATSGACPTTPNRYAIYPFGACGPSEDGTYFSINDCNNTLFCSDPGCSTANCQTIALSNGTDTTCFGWYDGEATRSCAVSTGASVNISTTTATTTTATVSTSTGATSTSATSATSTGTTGTTANATSSSTSSGSGTSATTTNTGATTNKVTTSTSSASSVFAGFAVVTLALVSALF